jgi:hypothetical protein
MKKLSEASSVYVAGEPLPEDSLLVAKFDLPPELAWFNELNVQERIDFFVGLLEVLAKPELTLPDGRQRTPMDAINEYLRGWQATVELCSNPEIAEEIAAAEKGPFREPYSSFNDCAGCIKEEPDDIIVFLIIARHEIAYGKK